MHDYFLALGTRMVRFSVTPDASVRLAWSLDGRTYRQFLASVPEARRQYAALLAKGWTKW